MSGIKELLHKYLSEDAIIVCELSEKSNDYVWLENQGYYNRVTGKETENGKIYTEKHNERISFHFEKIKDNSLDVKNLNKLRNELNKGIGKKSINVYENLTESEAFAYRYIVRGQW